MAVPFKSILGNFIGLTRETTTQRGNVLFSRRGFAGPYLYLHATEPTGGSTSSIVDIEGLTTVTNSATGTAAISPRGITLMATGASSLYTLAAPPGPGVQKTFFSHSTAAKQVVSAVHIVRGIASSGGGDAGIIAASTAHTAPVCLSV